MGPSRPSSLRQPSRTSRPADFARSSRGHGPCRRLPRARGLIEGGVGAYLERATFGDVTNRGLLARWFYGLLLWFSHACTWLCLRMSIVARAATGNRRGLLVLPHPVPPGATPYRRSVRARPIRGRCALPSSMSCWSDSRECSSSFQAGSVRIAAARSKLEHFGTGGPRPELVWHAAWQEDDGTGSQFASTEGRLRPRPRSRGSPRPGDDYDDK